MNKSVVGAKAGRAVEKNDATEQEGGFTDADVRAYTTDSHVLTA